jgi:murein DD-endopeptidase MepM/ murein hydrolase activator NlpD
MNIAKGMLFCVLIVVLIGLTGFARISLIIIAAVSDTIAYHRVSDENGKLSRHVLFFEKRTREYRNKFNKIVDCEKTLRRKYDIKHIPVDARLAGVGGASSSEEQLTAPLLDPSLRAALELKSDMAALIRQAILEDTLFHDAADCVDVKIRRWRQMPVTRPAEGRITSRFGMRTDPMGGEDVGFHEGLDFANKIGTPVFATADGEVHFTGMQGTYGKVIYIAHENNGFETVYGHLVSFAVRKGQKVRRGDLIGFMGNTGRSTGPHLHYEVRKSGRPLNPEEYILPESILVD